MKKIADAVAGALLGAWKKQMDIPLPELLQEKKYPAGDLECAAFPLLGWLCGAAATLPGVLAAVVFNPFIGAFVYALSAWLLLTFRDSGRSDGMIANMISGMLPGDAIPWRNVIPVMMMILKFALLMTIFYSGNAWHLMLVCGAAFTIEAQLTLDGGFMPPLLNDSSTSRRNMWITAVILLLISFLCCRLPSALGALTFAVVWKIFQSRTVQNNGTTLAEISFAGGITCWISLFAGVLAI